MAAFSCVLISQCTPCGLLIMKKTYVNPWRDTEPNWLPRSASHWWNNLENYPVHGCTVQLLAVNKREQLQFIFTKDFSWLVSSECLPTMQKVSLIHVHIDYFHVYQLIYLSFKNILQIKVQTSHEKRKKCNHTRFKICGGSKWGQRPWSDLLYPLYHNILEHLWLFLY